jgi:hypothetical protein
VEGLEVAEQSDESDEAQEEEEQRQSTRYDCSASVLRVDLLREENAGLL